MRAEIEAIDAAVQRIEEDGPPPDAIVADVDELIAERDGMRGRLRPVPVAAAALALLLLAAGAGYWFFRPEPAPLQPVTAQTPADDGLSYVYRTQPVYFRSTYPAGTVVVHKPQHFLYVVQGDQRAVRYGFALGKECADIGGVLRVTQKQEPLVAAPGAASTEFTQLVLHLSEEAARIHPTRSPKAIGQALGNGCIQLVPPGMVDLYGRVPVGARVVVTN
jgi:lipoprotein-anchoring transpeptidase ErfK/SrfK